MKPQILFILFCVSFIFSNKITAQDCPAETQQVVLSILTDNWPSEVGWSLIGNTMIYGEYPAGFLTEPDSNYVWEFCIPVEECLIFTISDVYGDGLNSVGNYRLLVDGVEVGQGSNYGFGETLDLECPPGYSCNGAITAVSDLVYTTPNSNYYYEFTADTTGVFEISTCDLNACDTKIWVYDDCPDGIPADDNTGTIYYDDNEGGCGELAQVNALLEVGQTIYIRIGEVDSTCVQSVNWQVTYNGSIMGCTNPASCNYNALAVVDDGSCIQQGSPDCTGACNGSVLMGDLDGNEMQDLIDAQDYITQILGNDIMPTPCNDLNDDNEITVYDAALLNDCLNHQDGHIHDGGVDHDHCDFPAGVINPNDTVAISIIDHNPSESYIDIGILNNTSKVAAYEFSLSGIMMTNVESLTDGTEYPFTVQGNFDGDIIGLTYPDSVLEKTLVYQPMCRVYYQEMIDTEICISEIKDIINGDYEQTIPVIGGECILLTNDRNFTNDLEIRLQPNPFRDVSSLVIQYAENEPFELNILDVTGRVVQSYGTVYPGTVTIEQRGLPAGIYFYELIGGGGKRGGKMSVE